jgi:ribonuclease H / adenosylcobalamin/alpha-ribazole phosphatase
VSELPADPRLHVVVHSDGASRSNPGPAGIGAVVTSDDGEVLAEISEGIGIATNNVAEYRAAIEGLRRARDLGADAVTLRADSKLLIEQLAGRWKIKNPTLQRLHREARELLREFAETKLEHLPRAFNAQADELANRGVDEWLAGEGRGWRPPDPNPTLV